MEGVRSGESKVAVRRGIGCRVGLRWLFLYIYITFMLREIIIYLFKKKNLSLSTIKLILVL